MIGWMGGWVEGWKTYDTTQQHVLAAPAEGLEFPLVESLLDWGRPFGGFPAAAGTAAAASACAVGVGGWVVWMGSRPRATPTTWVGGWERESERRDVPPRLPMVYVWVVGLVCVDVVCGGSRVSLLLSGPRVNSPSRVPVRRGVCAWL